MSATELSRLLTELARAIDALPPNDLSRLLAGEARLEIRAVPVEDHKEQAENSGKETRSGEALASVVQRLETLDSREAGVAYLASLALNKADLLAMSRCLDIPAQKRDSRGRLQEKIIEATIGFRIRSAAIQGTSQREDE